MAQTEAKNDYTVNNQLFRFVELNVCQNDFLYISTPPRNVLNENTTKNSYLHE